MRKIIVCVLAFCLLACVPAGAEEAINFNADLVFNASVDYTSKLVVNAPYSGTLASVDVRMGEKVAAGQKLFQMETAKLYAATAGTVVGIFAATGDDGKTIQDASGALVYIEPDKTLSIASNLSGAYDSWDNKVVHVGEQVYLRSRNNTKYTGEGVIISVKDTGEYKIQVESGNLRYNEPVSVYRAADFNDKTRIGIGDAKAAAPVAVNCEGTILNVLVSVGQHVTQGEALVEYAKDATRATAFSAVGAPMAALIVKAELSPGEAAEVGKAVVTLAPTADMVLKGKLTQYEVAKLSLGGAVKLQFEGGAIADGTVCWISYLTDDKSLYEVWVQTDLSARRIGETAVVALAE